MNVSAKAGFASMVSTTEIVCVQPQVDGPFPPPTYLEISCDGQQYTKSLVRYSIVGQPVAIDAVDAFSGTKTVNNVTADKVVRISQVAVYTVDKYGQQVLDYDPGTYTLTPSLATHSGVSRLAATPPYFVPPAVKIVVQ